MKLSPTQKEIINFLKSRGGQSPVGVIGTDRRMTIRYLEQLEKIGLLICLEPPVKRRTNVFQIGQEGFSSHCGIWKLAE